MLAEIVTGNETYSNPGRSYRIGCFYQKNPEDDPISVYSAIKDKHGGVSLVTRTSTNASAYNRNHGEWHNLRVDIAEGAFLSVSMEKRGGSGFAAEKAQVMLRARQGAAYIRLRIPLSQHTKAAHSAMYVEGRFDIISPDMFERFNLNVPDRFVDLYDSEFYEGFFQVEEVERAVTPLNALVTKKSKVKTKSGKEVTIKRKRRRNIRLT